MGKALKYLIAILLAPLVAAFVVVALRVLGTEVPWSELQWILLGLGGYVLVYPLIRSRNLYFVEVFEHELGHMVTQLTVFQVLTEFRVNPGENKSRVGYDPTTGLPGTDCFTTLAPYFLSVFTIPLIISRFFVPEQLTPWIDTAIGVSLGFHFVSLFREFRPRQTDLTAYTMPLSAVITVLLNTVLLMIVVVIVLDDFTVFADYVREVLSEAEIYYGEIFNWFIAMELFST